MHALSPSAPGAHKRRHINRQAPGFYSSSAPISRTNLPPAPGADKRNNTRTALTSRDLNYPPPPPPNNLTMNN